MEIVIFSVIRNGKLVRSGRCPADMIEAQVVNEGETVVTGLIDAPPENPEPPSPPPEDGGGEAAQLVRWRAAATMSPRQLFIGLMSEGFITEAEAVDAARTGAVPAAVEAVIATLPQAERAVARITWARMGVVERNDPLVGLLAVSAGQSPAQIDDFFRLYAGA